MMSCHDITDSGVIVINMFPGGRRCRTLLILFRILLDHVEYLLCSVEPNVMIWNCHRLKCHLLGVLKVGVRSPDLIEPLYR